MRQPTTNNASSATTANATAGPVSRASGTAWRFQMPPRSRDRARVPYRSARAANAPAPAASATSAPNPSAVATSHGAGDDARHQGHQTVPPRARRDERHAQPQQRSVGVNPAIAIADARHHGAAAMDEINAMAAITPSPAPTTTAPATAARRRTDSTAASSPPRSDRPPSAQHPAHQLRRGHAADGQRAEHEQAHDHARIRETTRQRQQRVLQGGPCNRLLNPHAASVDAGCGGTTMSRNNGIPGAAKATSPPRRA